MDRNNRPTGGYESPHKDEYDKMVEQIKAKRKALSTSIWTDEPLLKPEKSIWLDDDEPQAPAKKDYQPKREEPKQAKSAQSDDSYYAAFVSNPVISDSRSEKMEFESTPKNYDDVIMPFINDYSVERKLPDQRRNLSRRPKANAAVDTHVSRQRSAQAQRTRAVRPAAQTPPVHKLRNERFFDEEGEPLYRHTPEKSKRKRPTMVPASEREENRPKAAPPSRRAAAAVMKKAPEPDDRGNSGEKPVPLAVARAQKDLEFFNASVCLGAIFVIAAILLVLTVLGKREKESESEKRKLAEFPKFSFSSLFSGEFTNGITTYFTDTIPGRERFKNVSAGFTNLFGFNIGDVKINGTLKKVEQEKFDEKSVTTTKVSINTAPVTTTAAPESQKEGGSSSESSSQKSNTKKDEVVKIPENTNEGKMLGNIIVYGSGKETRGLSVSYVNFEMGKRFAEALNKWKADLGDSVNVYSMPCPLSSAFYLPSNMKDQGSDQNENIKNINGNLKGVGA